MARNTRKIPKKRATAVIHRAGKFLIFRRVKRDSEYFVFPGGGAHRNETVEQALFREIEEELGLKIREFKFLFSIRNLRISNKAINYSKDEQDHYYFLITAFRGVPRLGGQEKDTSHSDNQYNIEWLTLDELKKKKKIYPRDIARRLEDHIR